MADEEVNYASVTFNTKKLSRSQVKKEEETIYDDVKVKHKTTEQTPDTNKFSIDERSGSRRHHYQQLACCLGTFCVILVLGIIAVTVYHRKCKPCQKGWDHVESSCYATNDADSNHWKTWEAARKDCRGKSSDLVVVINEEEMKTASEKSWKYNENKGYWIGLRVEDGKWKWLDGRNMTNSSWIDQRPSDGHCAISVQNQGFKSVSCNEKNRWICKKKALSV
ncbi:C-type lectin lectoxin-Phi1-like [Oreochromis aureus]|nr:C-type lectin lectoxin-Phi1-like [Oreochromis aureus]